MKVYLNDDKTHVDSQPHNDILWGLKAQCDNLCAYLVILTVMAWFEVDVDVFVYTTNFWPIRKGGARRFFIGSKFAVSTKAVNKNPTPVSKWHEINIWNNDNRSYLCIIWKKQKSLK